MRTQTKFKTRAVFVFVILSVSLGLIWQNHIRPNFFGTDGAVVTEILSSLDRPVAPDFSLFDLKGNEVHLSDYRGSVVFLGFWTTW